jgi:alpha,alpha-trehalose phosphorylase
VTVRRASFPVEPWRLRETSLELDVLAQTESLFALGNGHIGLRGNLDEGEPAGIPGSYLAGFHEMVPLPYAEPAYGDPEAGETVVNVTNGKLFRLLVADEPFDIRYGTLLSHERELDLRTGLLLRTVRWASPAGHVVNVRSTRMVSFARRAIAAFRYEVWPENDPLSVVVQSELVTNEKMVGDMRDPRASTLVIPPLRAEYGRAAGERAILVHATQNSGLLVGAGMDHELSGGKGVTTASEGIEDLARLTIAADVAPDRPLQVTKHLAYGWSAERSQAAIRDQVVAALASSRAAGWDQLCDEQKLYLDRFWADADVEIDGDEELQQAVRFALFHLLQAGARTEHRAIAAKGLTGPGYDGHTFWDTETFVMPVLTYSAPHAVRDALIWRHSTLPKARERATQLGLRGAAFPWRTIAGSECSGYWPASTAAFHLNGDIAEAVGRYTAATADHVFDREIGTELLVETARLWCSLGHLDGSGSFCIDGVTGPDEYSAIADNNIYTNLTASKNLLAAADAVERNPDRGASLKVGAGEVADWRSYARAIKIPYDEHLEVHQQSADYTAHAEWDFPATEPDQYPLFLHFPYFDLYRKQVVKQADLVLAMHLSGDTFDEQQKARNFAYYEKLTVRDSSLSAATQAVLAAELGHLDLALLHFREASLVDLEDIQHNTRDGLHMASLAGAWLAAVAGFGGMRDQGGRLSFVPRLAPGLERLAFRLGFQGRRLSVEITVGHASYTLLEGEALEISHHGSRVTVKPAQVLELEIPDAPSRPAPTQPPGRPAGLDEGQVER